MTIMQKSKEDIYRDTILSNIRRKSRYADAVCFYNKIPLFSWLDINLTELCNRTCQFCPRSDRLAYLNQRLFISVELCRKIAHELKDLQYKGAVVFSGFGEPLLHPDITELAACFGKEIPTEIVTNGDVLTKELIRSLVAAGISKIVVSLYDGPHQIEYFKSLFADAGCSAENYILRDRWYSEDEDYGVKLTNRAGVVRNGKQGATDRSRACYYTHYSMMIDWNGDVLLCVQDWNKKAKMGNVYADSLLGVWTSSNLEKYRSLLGEGHRDLQPCTACNVDGMLHGSNHYRAWNTRDGVNKDLCRDMLQKEDYR